MKNNTVVKAVIKIGSIKIDAYSAGEIDEVTGAPINYLSGKGLADSIGLHHDTVADKRMAQGLKAMLGEDFTTAQKRFKMDSGGVTKLKLWKTTDAAKYYRYHDRKGNEKAGLIVEALLSTTLDIIINDALGRDYVKGQTQNWAKARLEGKGARRTLTDAIKDWYERNPGVTSCPPHFMYSNTTNAIYKALWGMTATQIEELLGTKKDQCREGMSKRCLDKLKMTEDRVAEFIDEDNLKPTDAVVAANIRRTTKVLLV